VLVQGPPGTGKSHTIANLICHLLATGQRTLITAKTPRALQVLEGLIPDELRPLCINLLGSSGIDERRSLQSSVNGILRKNDSWDAYFAQNERQQLEKLLQELRGESVIVTKKLRDIRESETHTQSVGDGDYRGTASRIAKDVNRDRAANNWFTDCSSPYKTCPASSGDLRSVLEALRQFTPEKRGELGLAWPNELPSPKRFAELVTNEKAAKEEEERWARGADERLASLLSQNSQKVIEDILSVFLEFRNAYRTLLGTPHVWMKGALRDILRGNSFEWHELARVTRAVTESIEELVPAADENQVEFPANTHVRSLYKDVCVLKEHMEAGGRLRGLIFRPKLVKERLYVLKSVRVGGRPCSAAEHFSALADALRVQIELDKAWDFWEGRIERTKGSKAVQLASLVLQNKALEKALATEELILKYREAANQCPGIGEPDLADEFEIEKVVFSCRLALARCRKRIAAEEIKAIEEPISQMAGNEGAHQETADLLIAVRQRDVDQFERCSYAILDLEKQRRLLEKADEDLSKLRRSLPQLAESLEQTRNEPYWEERIQNIEKTWHWAQARYWIEDYIRQDDVPALEKRAKQIEDEINITIAKLASLCAWSFCFSRLEEGHRRHMETWQKSMGKLGQGQGKHAEHHRSDAQYHLNECREAVPAWVMPLHRVWDTVKASPGMF
jgi:3-deoxy-D-manno-octulosonate 8-phosphate phosphatase KdsC-like HAD superfamily phosphatase